MSPKNFHRFFFFACLTGFHCAVGQNIIKETVKVNDERCTYYTTQSKENIIGIVLLLPGRGESPRQVFKNTSLPGVLAAKGYLTVIPDLHYSLFAGKTIKAQITQILKAQSLKYNLNNPDLLIGGFSAGGAVAVSYSEFLLSSDSATSLKGIFVIDPPLDLERLYNSAERMLKYNCSDLIQKEGARTKDFLDKSLGGSQIFMNTISNNMKKCFTILVIIAFTSCNQNKYAREIDKESSLGALTTTSQDTIDVLNVYKLNIQEGNLNTIQTTWAEDARWLNAFGRVFVGRDTVISWLKYLYSMPGYAASSITRQDEPQIAFIRPDVAILHEYHEREGQIINGVITPTRKINTTYILSKEKGTWLIRDKVTMDERGQSN